MQARTLLAVLTPWLSGLCGVLFLAACGGDVTGVPEPEEEPQAAESWRPEGLELPALVRFWTDGCPFCIHSLPLIDDLAAEHPGLATLAIYHPKPAGRSALSPAEIETLARELGFSGEVRSDLDWALLRKIAPEAGRTSATSVSVLLDGEGQIVWRHPGPQLEEGDPGLEQAIGAVLK